MAPASIAASTCSSSPKIVLTIGATPGQRVRAAAITSSPLPSGRPRSTSSTSGACAIRSPSAASASARVAAAQSSRMSGAAFSAATSAMRQAASSSTTATSMALAAGDVGVMRAACRHLAGAVMSPEMATYKLSRLD